jgi:hypothetical protein
METAYTNTRLLLPFALSCYYRICLYTYTQKQEVAALHEEQLQAYQQAAEQALLEYGRTFALPPGEGDPAFVQRCLRLAVDAVPAWKISRPACLALLQKVIEERASSKSNVSSENTNDVMEEEKSPGEDDEEHDDGGEEAAATEEDDEDLEDGEEEEHTNEEEQEGDASKTAAAESSTADSSLALKRKAFLEKKQVAGKTGKQTPRKKTGIAKAQAPKPSRTNIRRSARRGGRGGGSNVK